jgi:sugar lactone lactonase YvrE
MAVFVSGLGVPEGPALLPDGSWLCVDMAAGHGCVTHISADGSSKRVVARTGRPSGLAVDRHGVIWVAESAELALLRVTLDGEAAVFLTACAARDFSSPTTSPSVPWDRIRSTSLRTSWARWRPSTSEWTACRSSWALD